jgi:hypothetical protein
VKVRSFITWFHSTLREDSGIQWLCYIDDDMYVNVNNLNTELSGVLASPPPTCSDPERCVVADVGPIKLPEGDVVRYSNAIWCMTMPTLNAVAKLFREKTDAELNWSGSDDVGFARALGHNLNITFADGPGMYSINNRVAVSPPGRQVNPADTYTTRKVNTRGDKDEWLYLSEHKAASDVLARMSVLNLPHVNYTDLCLRHGAHQLPYGTSPRLLVDMKQWHAYVAPKATCRQPLSRTLRVNSSESFILQFK